jgi:hypothetical protein
MAVEQEEQLQQSKRRLFSRAMKEDCWNKAMRVPLRAPDRWRYDAVGNPVLRPLTNCDGVLCYEYDHIIPYSSGGATNASNCQILQSRVNRLKSNQLLTTDEMNGFSSRYEYSMEEMDLVEMSVYGDVKRAHVEEFYLCRCKSDYDKLRNSQKEKYNVPQCARPYYENQTRVNVE